MDLSEYPAIISEIMDAINSQSQPGLLRETLRDTSNPQSVFLPGYGDH
jgi:hypothetical protein